MRLTLILLLWWIVATGVLGCGNVKRVVAGLTGEPSEYCFAGVKYLQFPSGSTVALDRSGKPIECN